MLQWKNPKLAAILVILGSLAATLGNWGWHGWNWGW